MSSNYVYVIVNKINLKLYFGSHSWEGEGLDPSYLGSGKIIKQAVKKYGRDNFIIQPIKFYPTVEECRKAEEELLRKYDIANNQYCYNIKNSAIGWDKGLKRSEEFRRKISESKKGCKLSDEHRKKIAQAMTGENNPMYNKNFSEEHRKNLSQAHKGKPVSETQKDALLQANNYRKTPVVAIDKNGKVKIFESQNECSRVLGVNDGNINSCLKGRIKQARGYTFKYIEQLDSGIYEGML